MEPKNRYDMMGVHEVQAERGSNGDRQKEWKREAVSIVHIGVYKRAERVV